MSWIRRLLVSRFAQRRQDAKCSAMANTANVLSAAEMAGVDRTNHYLWLKKDPDYAEAFEIARMRGADVLEGEACAGHSKASPSRYSTAGSAPSIWCRIQTAPSSGTD